MYKIFAILIWALVLIPQNALAVNVVNSQTTSSLESLNSDTNSFMAKTKDTLEVFRLKEADYFSNLRDTTKIKLGIQVKDDIFNKLAPKLLVPSVNVSIPATDQKNISQPEIKKLDNPVDYVTLVFSTSMAALFSSFWMFYGFVLFLAFFLIRTILGMIF